MDQSIRYLECEEEDSAFEMWETHTYEYVGEN